MALCSEMLLQGQPCSGHLWAGTVETKGTAPLSPTCYILLLDNHSWPLTGWGENRDWTLAVMQYSYPVAIFHQYRFLRRKASG